MSDAGTSTMDRQGAPAREPYHRVFEQALEPDAVERLRSVIGQTLGRRGDLGDGQRDQKWWVSLGDFVAHGKHGVAKLILESVVPSAPVQAAMKAVGDDPVAILQYCIFRRFDPRRNPVPAHWHFDANILGTETRMVNTWFPLVDVGETAPGITFVLGARRPDSLWQRLVDLADADGMFTSENRWQTLFPDADVDAAVMADPQAELVTPIVSAGGAISFDQQYLHGTQHLTAAMGLRDSFEFRVMSEKVARSTGLASQHKMLRLQTA